MAAIESVLNQAPLDADSGSPDTSVVAPHPAPGVDAPTPLSGKKPTLTADEKRAWDAARVERRDAQTEQEKEAARQLQAQQEEESVFDRTAKSTVDAFSNVIKGTQVRLESLPTPGSLLLPLIVLLIFFFLLIPVNGHTRLVWFWLVISGNAEIAVGGQSDSNATATTPTTPTGAATVTSNALTPQLVTPGVSGDNYTGRTMTGVEGS
jgi:hypothetical protein